MRKIYRIYGIENAIELMRPGAKYNYIANGSESPKIEWLDKRPCPTLQEIQQTLKQIKDFENSLKTIWLDEQIEQFDQLGLVEFLPPWDNYLMYKTYFEHQKNNSSKRKNKNSSKRKNK